MSEPFAEPQALAAPTIAPKLLMGAAVPLWGYYAGAAMTGVAFWLMTRWTQPSNLEALFAGMRPAARPLLDAMPDTVAESEAVAEAVLEPVVEAVAEAEVPFVPTAEVLTSEPSPAVAAAPVAASAPAANDPAPGGVKTA